MTVQGNCEPRFARVREEFERNFAERGEVGASVCLMLDGEPVVDLWGGVADPEKGNAWESDTISAVMSSSKGMTALAAHILLDRGQLDLNAPVASYWPEFAKNGKENILVRHVFTHQSGVGHVSDEVPKDGFFHWDTAIQLVENTTPFWEPGTRVGYHAMTIGFLLGELVHRISGKSFGTFFREEVAEPLGLDCWFGLPEEHESRVAPNLTYDMSAAALPPEFLEAISNPDAVMSKIFTNNGGWWGGWDTRVAHAAEVPAVGAITNGRGLATAYSALAMGGSAGGTRIVSEDAIPRMRYARAMTDVDAVIHTRTAFTLGFSKSWDNRHIPIGGNSVIIGEDAFGTPGLGGQMGFADTGFGIGFGYTMNQHGVGTGLNDRGQSLVDAVYEILGSPSCEPGFWMRAR